MLRHKRFFSFGRKQVLFLALATMCLVVGVAAYGKRELFKRANTTAPIAASQTGQPTISTYVASGIPVSLYNPSISVSQTINTTSVFLSSVSFNVFALPGSQLIGASLT
ncbi:MAG: hypothetical protein ACRD82_11185, partial [Blastocatellia bacterium]